MRSRLMAALLALVLAAGGTVLLLAYVQSAHAGSGPAPTTTVLLASERIPKGTAAQQVADMTRAAAVPDKLVVPGALHGAADLRDRAGQLTTVDIQAGEQLLAARFAKPSDLAREAGATMPPGMEEVTIPVAPERAVGGDLRAGQRVGVYVSGSPDPKNPTTHLALSDVLVIRVQGAPATAASPAAATGSPRPGATPAPLPSGGLFVTVALSPSDAELLIFGMEHASVWLSRETATTPPSGISVKTWKEING